MYWASLHLFNCLSSQGRRYLWRCRISRWYVNIIFSTKIKTWNNTKAVKLRKNDMYVCYTSFSICVFCYRGLWQWWSKLRQLKDVRLNNHTLAQKLTIFKLKSCMRIKPGLEKKRMKMREKGNKSPWRPAVNLWKICLYFWLIFYWFLLALRFKLCGHVNTKTQTIHSHCTVVIWESTPYNSSKLF